MRTTYRNYFYLQETWNMQQGCGFLLEARVRKVKMVEIRILGLTKSKFSDNRFMFT